jgi:SAM-dependent methyltransferase
VLRFLRDLYHKLPEPPSANYSWRNFDINPYELLPERAVILDIGSKDAKGKYAFGTPPENAKIVCVDIEDGPGVDVVADAHNLHMIEDESVDLVVIISVLQYMEDPWAAIAELWRVLKVGGVIYISSPFILHLSNDPVDYYRFTPEGLKLICKKFKCLDYGFNRGPASTFLQLMVHFLAILFSFGSKKLYGINVDIFKWLFFWIKYLDIVIARYSYSDIVCTGVFFIGKKISATDRF